MCEVGVHQCAFSPAVGRCDGFIVPPHIRVRHARKIGRLRGVRTDTGLVEKRMRQRLHRGDQVKEDANDHRAMHIYNGGEPGSDTGSAAADESEDQGGEIGFVPLFVS